MATQVTVNAGQGSTQVTVITGEGSTSYKVEAGSRGPVGATGAAGANGATGATGATGAAGPNTITTSTTSNLTGFIAANGTAVSGATAGVTAATANTLALRDATGGAFFADVGASSVTSDGDIKISGETGVIWTEGSAGHIYTISGHIQSGSTFKLYNGTYTTTLSHSPTANRAIAFPNKAGTVAMIDSETHTGAHAFSSTTRPTSAGTGTPEATSLITLSDLADRQHFIRHLYNTLSGTASGVGATSRRAVANGIVDGDISTLGISGSYYRVNTPSFNLAGNAAAGALYFGRKWSILLSAGLNFTTNISAYWIIGGDGTAGIVASGDHFGVEFTNNTNVRLYKCVSGVITTSSTVALPSNTIATGTSQTSVFYLWLDNDGVGTVSLRIASQLYAASTPEKPSTALATLAVTTSGITGTSANNGMYIRATGTPGTFAGLAVYDLKVNNSP